ncbi:MAG TPA: rhodanese-like domain-containing protein [Caldisericia bacterium]|nr:rhodanese-like domain-containing protein [Caldisericia bacterium]HPF48660.1 rhodanese-like domain-containing protein [Caldisericia bacterium]HPI83680.1 rhodanese-like domain-containing protein [Caldisericia bacterium]HPQ93115.1 rhodanese-like domain-containing protein [Caldisericia bacterium]HRV75052.1 rhodanese-like domain-containing protein [Caldisericia bacterium]
MNVFGRLTAWIKQMWASRRWSFIATLALVLIVATSWFWLPVQTKWKLTRSFRNFWRAITEDWDDKWDTFTDILGISDDDGASLAAACADCDICAVAQARFLHKYDVDDVEEIIREGGVSILTEIPPLFIDIRDVEDYEAGHIPVAINMPLVDLMDDIWPNDRTTPVVIIGYGNEDYVELEKMLVIEGLFNNAGYLVGGMPEWTGEVEIFK